MASGDVDFVFKILVIGDSSVGKTALILRYCDQQFVANYLATIGVDLKHRRLNVDGKEVKLQLWDTAGQERYRTMVSAFYKGAHAYDITNPTSFRHVENWVRQIQQALPEDNIVRALIGTKCDLESERKVPAEKGRDLAAHYGIPFFETSALQDVSIESTFESLVRTLIQKQLSQTAPPSAPIKLSPTDGTSSRCNC